MKSKYNVTIIVALIAAAGTIIAGLVTQNVHISINLPQTNVTSLNRSYLTSEMSSSSSQLFADNQNGKWGYVDQFGNEIIPHVYDWADDFVEDYAAVFKNNSWGFIDKNETVVIPFKYNGAWSFSNGLAPVFNGDKWGFIDKNGNVKIPFKYKDISCMHKTNGRVYADENDIIIDYATEINNAKPSSSTSKPSGNSSNTSTPPENTKSNVPIRDFLKSNVSATLTGSNLNIMVKKEQAEELNKGKTFPFRWGVQLADGLGNSLVGDYIIELELCIDSDGSVKDTNATVYLKKSSDRMDQIQQNITPIYAYFDGNDYVISCDISNDYISLDDICINTVFHC